MATGGVGDGDLDLKGLSSAELRSESGAIEVQLASLEHQVASQADETLEDRLTEFQSEEEVDSAGTSADTPPPAVEIEESVNHGAGRTEDRRMRRDITVPPLSQLAQQWWTTGKADTCGTTSGGARPRVSFQEQQLGGRMRIARYPTTNSDDGPTVTPHASSNMPRRSKLSFDPTVPRPMSSTFTLASLNRRPVANDASTPKVEAAEAPSFRESTVERWSHAPARLSRQNVVNRLPKLKLEPYHGDPKEWTLWIETFRVTVHDIVQDDALRLAYLRESLSPEVRKSLQMLLYRPELVGVGCDI